MQHPQARFLPLRDDALFARYETMRREHLGQASMLEMMRSLQQSYRGVMSAAAVARKFGVIDCFRWVYTVRLGNERLRREIFPPGFTWDVEPYTAKVDRMAVAGYHVLPKNVPLKAGDVLWYGYAEEKEHMLTATKSIVYQEAVKHCGIVAREKDQLFVECKLGLDGNVVRHELERELPCWGDRMIAFRLGESSLAAVPPEYRAVTVGFRQPKPLYGGHVQLTTEDVNPFVFYVVPFLLAAPGEHSMIVMDGGLSPKAAAFLGMVVGNCQAPLVFSAKNDATMTAFRQGMNRKF